MGQVRHMERGPKSGPVRDWLEKWDADGPFIIVIFSGDRMDMQQAEDFAKGRLQLADGSWTIVDHFAVVTNALRADDSAHGHKDCAVDVYPVRELFDSGGVKLVYLGSETDPAVRAEAVRRLGMIDDSAESAGLETGRHYPGLCDQPHVCRKDWRTQPLVDPPAAP